MGNKTAYASPLDLRLQADVDRDVADPVLVGLLMAASRVVDGVCNRPDGFVASTEATERRYRGTGRAFLRIDECFEIAAVVQDDRELAGWHGYHGSLSDASFVPPYWAILLESGVFVKRLLPNVRVTARWGYADEVPENIKQATITQAARWWMRGRSVWADAVMPDSGAGMLVYRQVLDPDIVLMLHKARMVRVTI